MSLAAYVAEDVLVGHHWEERSLGLANFKSSKELWGYWLVHIVVPPIGLQIPLAPWVLSLAPPLGVL